MTDLEVVRLARDLEALSSRVADLETAAVAGRAGRVASDDARPADPAPTLDADTFWALEALRARLPGPEADVAVPGGAVVFTGIADTANGRAEWQYGQTTAALVESDEGTDEIVATQLAALGSPARVRLMRELLLGRDTVADLVALEGFGTTGQVYHHVRTLTAAGWLRSAGRSRFAVPPERVIPLLVILAAAR